MTERELAQAPTAGLIALTAFNAPAYQSHAVLTDLLRQRLSERHALLFARPVVTQGRIVFTTAAAGPIRAWGSLAPVDRGAMEATRLKLGGELTELMTALARGGVNTRDGNAAQLLRAALAVPSAANIYAVGQQPVLTFWGFRAPDGTLVDPFAAALPVAPRVRRHWWLWPLVLLLLLSLAGLLAWLFWPHPPAIVVPPPKPHVAPQVETPAPAPPPKPVLPPNPQPPPVPPPAVPAPPNPAPQADLPKDAWDRHDLTALSGCWLLGKQVTAGNYNAFGMLVEKGVTRSARLCLDRSGHGTEEERSDFPSGHYECNTTVRAFFAADGKLNMDRPVAKCTPARLHWGAAKLRCVRRDDNVADCLETNDNGKADEEFRRAH